MKFEKPLSLLVSVISVFLLVFYPGSETAVSAMGYEPEKAPPPSPDVDLNVSAGRASAYLDARRRELLRRQLRQCVSGSLGCASSGWSVLLRATGGREKTSSLDIEEEDIFDASTEGDFWVANTGVAYKFSEGVLEGVRIGALVGLERSDVEIVEGDETRIIESNVIGAFLAIPIDGAGYVLVEGGSADQEYQYKASEADGRRNSIGVSYGDALTFRRGVVVRYQFAGSYSKSKLGSYRFDRRLVGTSSSKAIRGTGSVALDVPFRAGRRAVLVPTVGFSGSIQRSTHSLDDFERKESNSRQSWSLLGGVRLLKANRRYAINYSRTIADKYRERESINISIEVGL